MYHGIDRFIITLVRDGHGRWLFDGGAHLSAAYCAAARLSGTLAEGPQLAGCILRSAHPGLAAQWAQI